MKEPQEQFFNETGKHALSYPLAYSNWLESHYKGLRKLAKSVCREFDDETDAIEAFDKLKKAIK